MNALINTPASLKKLNKNQKKFQQKPLITRCFQNSIHNKTRLNFNEAKQKTLLY